MLPKKMSNVPDAGYHAPATGIMPHAEAKKIVRAVRCSGAAPYSYVTGATPATIKVSAACNGWMYDGTVMRLTR
jgi:hypothetical protein